MTTTNEPTFTLEELNATAEAVYQVLDVLQANGDAFASGRLTVLANALGRSGKVPEAAIVEGVEAFIGVVSDAVDVLEMMAADPELATWLKIAAAFMSGR